LVALGNLLSTEFMKPRRWLFINLGQWALVPHELRNRVLKQPMKHRMIRLDPKPWNMYDNKKKDVLTNDRITKIQLFPLDCGPKDLINKIYSNYVNWKQNINFVFKMRVDIEHWTNP
jgi:hypothetical protein